MNFHMKLVVNYWTVSAENSFRLKGTVHRHRLHFITGSVVDQLILFNILLGKQTCTHVLFIINARVIYCYVKLFYVVSIYCIN